MSNLFREGDRWVPSDGIRTDEITDGFHTFGELYEHRRALTMALISTGKFHAWRSRAHHPEDSPCFVGYFIVGIDLPTGTVTYHYADRHWDDFSHGTDDLDHAPKWDGATPADTVSRLMSLARADEVEHD